jgi:hypothetical protein
MCPFCHLKIGMDNLSLFLESIIHAEHRVGGFKLQDLSLYHLALIDKYCPDALGGDCSKSDLCTAIVICASKDFKDFKRLTGSLQGWLMRYYNLSKMHIGFGNYITDHMSFPEMGEIERDVSNNPFPYSLMFAARLIKDTGYSFDHVFYRMSVSQVFWLISALGYLESGETTVISDKEKWAIKALTGDLTNK